MTTPPVVLTDTDRTTLTGAEHQRHSPRVSSQGVQPAAQVDRVGRFDRQVGPGARG